MNKSKWIWRGIFAFIVLCAICYGISRHVHMNKLAHNLRFGSQSEKVSAAKELMERDRLYDKMQEMTRKERIKAMDTIEKTPGELTVKQCILLLKDTKATVRDRVTKTLIMVAKDHVKILVPAMKDPDANVSGGVKTALVGIGPSVIPYVEPAAKQTDLRGAAFDVLTRLGEPSVPALIRLLEKGDQDVRMAAAGSLGKVGSMKATPALLKATNDIKAVRRIAISSLCAICDPSSLDLLVDVLGHTRDDGEVRARTARALSVIGGPKAIDALTNALGDWDLKVRTSVISGLQRIGAPAVRPVITAMSSGSQDVRRAGAAVLERIDSPESGPVLVRLAGDNDPMIRASAAIGLGVQSVGVRTDLLISLLSDKDGKVSDAAVGSLASMESRAVPALISVFRSSRSDVVKYQAADALASIGSPAVASLISALNTDKETSKWAVYTLGRVGDPRAKPALEKFAGASDPEKAWVVKRALDRL